MTAPDAATFVAVDLGASSGRVVAGQVIDDRVQLTEVNRFPNTPVRVSGTLHTDILGLYREVLTGLRTAGRRFGHLASVGVDSWAVDYGLLDWDGELLGDPVHYRDSRTDGVMAKVHTVVPASEMYAVTGIQLLPFNTVFQLMAARETAGFAAARTMLLLPDLLSYWLTGQITAEVTNASTTGLYDATSQTWSASLLERLELPARLFPPLRRPGSRVGVLRDDVLAETGLKGPVAVTAVGTHDTASAVVAVPAQRDDFAYISCGTWSLVGVELDRPVLTDQARQANFTNEAGVDSTIRFLRNVMGLWLLQECLRSWSAEDEPADLGDLVAAAAHVTPFAALINPDAPEFLAPGDMPSRIARFCRASAQVPPAGRAETVRCILDSLALAYRAAVHEAAALSGHSVGVVHLVGGGAQNALLCQLTADACELPVLAGPVEATALGNILVQARSNGLVTGGLDVLRGLSARSSRIDRYEPGDPGPWRSAADRFSRFH